jgi:MFS family permease
MAAETEAPARGRAAAPRDLTPAGVARVQRRTLRLLVGTQIVGGVGVAIGIAVGALLAARMAGTSASGLAGSAAVVGAALLAIPATYLMRTGGRRAGLAFAYLVGGLGALAIVAAAVLDWVPLLFAGIFLFGGGNTANLQARYAAVDLAEPARRGRQLSLVVWATTVGAVAGPNLAQPTDRALAALSAPLSTAGSGPPEYVGPYLFSALAFAAAAAAIAIALRPDPLLTARALETRALETRALDAQVLEARGLEARTLDASASDPRALDTEILDGHASDAHALDAHALDARSPDARDLEARALEARALDAHALDARSPDARDLEARALEARALEARALDARVPGAGEPAALGSVTGEPAAVAVIGRGSWRRAVRIVARTPGARLGMAAVAVGHLVMVAVMVMTPVHLEHMHPQADVLQLVGVVLSLHIAGMFALSPVVGLLTDRLGRRPVILGGIGVLLAACAVAGTAGHRTPMLAAGLTLLGLGWSATMVAGSTLLSESVPVADRPGAQSLSDVVMGLAGAAAGAVSGFVVDTAGYPTLNLMAAIATVPLVALTLRRGAGERKGTACG